MIFHHPIDPHHHRIGRCAGYAESFVAQLAQTQGHRQCQRMTRPRLLLGGCYDPYIVAQRRGDFFKNSKARGIDPVVIGQKNTHQLLGSRRFMLGI